MADKLPATMYWNDETCSSRDNAAASGPRQLNDSILARGRFSCFQHALSYKLTVDLLRSSAMKAFLLACAAAIVIAVAGFIVLDRVQEPVQEAFATTGVRL
jgi:hypothetical protein